MLKGSKESWDGLQIIFSATTLRAAVKIEKMCLEACLKIF